MLLFLLLILLLKFVQGINPGYHTQQAEKLTKKLEEQGYTVQRGSYGYLTAEECQKMRKCYANNPSSPYGLVYLPKGPQEDISTYSKWGAVLSQNVDGVEMSATFRLDVRETIVMLGQTPPRSLYYSWVPYVFDRWFPQNWTSSSSESFGKCPDVTDRNGARCEIFASLGNPINMLHMNTSNEGGQSFNSAFAHFMGGDMIQVETVQKLSIDAGMQSSIHNIFALSTERIQFGLTPTGDGLIHLARATFTENKDELKEYIDYPSKYITILRITPPAGVQGASFPANKFNPRVSDLEQVTSEGISHQDLRLAVERDLKDGVKKAYQRTHRYVNEFALEAPIFEDGYDCMDDGLFCNGDNQDTLYPNSAKSILQDRVCTEKLGNNCPISKRTTLQEDGSDFFIATGVNHNSTARALYSSICMYNLNRLESIGQFTSMPVALDSNSYVGSADRYLENSNVSKHLFAVKITRKCNEGESFCLEVSSSGSNSLPLANSCLFIERIYLDQMFVGPTKDATVKPIVYHFSSKRV